MRVTGIIITALSAVTAVYADDAGTSAYKTTFPAYLSAYTELYASYLDD